MVLLLKIATAVDSSRRPTLPRTRHIRNPHPKLAPQHSIFKTLLFHIKLHMYSVPWNPSRCARKSGTPPKLPFQIILVGIMIFSHKSYRGTAGSPVTLPAWVQPCGWPWPYAFRAWPTRWDLGMGLCCWGKAMINYAKHRTHEWSSKTWMKGSRLWKYVFLPCCLAPIFHYAPGIGAQVFVPRDRAHVAWWGRKMKGRPCWGGRTSDCKIWLKGQLEEFSLIFTSSTAQVAVNHGWQSQQSKSTDGLKSGWICVCWSGCNGCSGHLTHNCWM